MLTTNLTDTKEETIMEITTSFEMVKPIGNILGWLPVGRSSCVGVVTVVSAGTDRPGGCDSCWAPNLSIIKLTFSPPAVSSSTRTTLTLPESYWLALTEIIKNYVI